MSSGPEHYREAERLLNIATSDAWSRAARTEAGPLAQVHATLALAAATALTGPIALANEAGDPDLKAWAEVAAEIPAGGES